MIKAGIIGGTGYTGETLVSLLLKHPNVKIEWATSESYSGKKLSDVYPHLKGLTDIICKKPDFKKLSLDVDVVFIALPHGLAMEIVPKIVSRGIKVIDLGADYRLTSSVQFEKWYGLDHKNPALLKKAVYGLPEAHREKIAKTQIVANPGCYATASILAGLPLVKSGKVDKNSIIIDAKSGVSGAGRSLSINTHFPECNEGLAAYKVASHRHTPEIEQELGASVTFVPHLIPMIRGILVALYAKVKKKTDFTRLYQDFYREESFVRIAEDYNPSTKYVYGTNYCDIRVFHDKPNNRIVVVSVIDNLIKGASGQAVQNMNIMFGLEEWTGLDTVAVYP